MCVLIGTGLEYASIGMAGYASRPMHIARLTTPQVSELMANALVNTHGLTTEQATDLLGHDAMRVQLGLLMGLPGFMDIALSTLHAKVKDG